MNGPALLLYAAISVAPISSTTAHNDGLCWWHCAQAILDECGIRRRLVDEVRASGRAEASIGSVERFLKIDLVTSFQDAIQSVNKGRHVIATVHTPLGRHAVVVVDVRDLWVTYWCPDIGRYGRISVMEMQRIWVVGVAIR